MIFASSLGVEPRTFGLEVQRAIHCATGTVLFKYGKINFQFLNYLFRSPYTRSPTHSPGTTPKVRTPTRTPQRVVSPLCNTPPNPIEVRATPTISIAVAAAMVDQKGPSESEEL